jgi:hypothetical protein
MEKTALNVAERLKEVEDTLNEYEKSIGLSCIKFKERYEEVFLSLDEMSIRSFSAEECNIKAAILLQYELYLQKEHNRHTAVLNWVEHNMKVILGGIVQDFGGAYSSFEERKILATHSNSYARELNKLLLKSKNMVDNLNFLSSRVSDLSRSLQELAKTKMRNEYDKSRIN